MRYRMNLQLFEDGGGAGSGNQGGNAGTGNGGQGSAGSASGAHGTGTYTYEQLEEIAGARVERSERTALANFFRNQGMTESEVTQAINNFKAERAANQPNTAKLQKDLDDALAKVQQMENEKTLSGKPDQECIYQCELGKRGNEYYKRYCKWIGKCRRRDCKSSQECS